MQNTKPWWMSKTIWTGLAMAILAVLSAAGLVPESFDASLIPEAITGILGLLAIIFRAKATDEIAPVLPKTEV